MIKIFLLILVFTINSFAIADDVVIEVEPKNPVFNESFNVTFKVRTTDSEEPYISFTPQGASVLGKRSQGLSISTVVINGKFTTTREQAIVYELSADREGLAYLRDIQIEVNGKTIKHKDVSIHVIKEAPRIPDAFIEAEASKTNVYLGEGLNVNYYLYFSTLITANDVKEFPKLNKFIKRFHHINSPQEVVEYKGKVMKRILIYSARLYGEKVGKAVLDPMKINAQIIETVRNGNFGFNQQRYKNVDLASQRIDVDILELPRDNVPSGFTGLVGDHSFKIIMNKDKYLVNEPIEFTLEVTGPGALENLDALKLYEHNNLEQFDTNSEVQEIGLDSGKKTFTYVYLARGPLKIEDREIEVAVFDAKTHKYITKKLLVPGFEVAGGGPVSNDSNTKVDQVASQSFKAPVMKNELGIMGPYFKSESFFEKNIFNIINSLMLAVLGYLVFTLKNTGLFKAQENLKLKLKKDIKNLKKEGMKHSSLYQLLMVLDIKNRMAEGVTLECIVKDSELSEDAKKYFISCLNELEKKTYADSISKNVVRVEDKYFDELERLL